MSIEIILLILAIVVLLVGSAFFSSSETALTAASDARMHALARRGDRRAGAVEALRRHRERLISSLLIGNNMVNVVATSLATSVAITLFQESGVLISSIIMTIVLVVFAEVLPKTYAFNNADRLALRVAKAVDWLVWTLTPLTLALDAVIGLVIPRRQRSDADLEEELRGMIALHGSAKSGDTDRIEEAVMLTSVLDLGEMTVDEVMTHRVSVAMVSDDLDPEIAFRQILASPYTRLPVYRGKSDNIVGVLHVKALLRAIGRTPDNVESIRMAEVAAKPYFVPETTLLIDQLRAFRARREHFAIVVDEYGDLRGIVTLEDILEEIVGDIDDELDDVRISGITPHNDGSWSVDGQVSVRDLNRALGWSLPDHATTVAGLIMRETRTIPDPGQEFRFYQTRFRIQRRKHNKIERIRIWREDTLTEA